MNARSQRPAASAAEKSFVGLQLRDKMGGAPHSTIALQLWLRLSSCATVVEKRLRAHLEQQFGTTLPRFQVLAAIGGHPGDPTMSQLSRSMMVSNGNITAVVNRLVEDGLIMRTVVDGRDRRVATVRLTRRGRASLARMAAAQQRWVDTMFADVPDERLRGLMSSLADLRGSVERSAL